MWSNGTIAISNKNGPNQLKSNPNWTPLTVMEEEHLLTKAAIPYRDPSGLSSKAIILERRQKEQRKSNMELTSNWKRRWAQTE